MKTLSSNSFMSNLTFLRRFTVGFITLFFGLGSLWSQTYNPKNGFTHYPNGTVYICNCIGGNGDEPIVKGPDGETVGCDTERERCTEILEEADNDAAAGGSGAGGGGASEGGEANTQAYSPEIRASVVEYGKKVKLKDGVWANQNGKWIHSPNSKEWTKQIIRSWKKKK